MLNIYCKSYEREDGLTMTRCEDTDKWLISQPSRTSTFLFRIEDKSWHLIRHWDTVERFKVSFDEGYKVMSTLPPLRSKHVENQQESG